VSMDRAAYYLKYLFRTVALGLTQVSLTFSPV
jgi:hypothetical protein